MQDWDDLKIFLALAHCGSITAAAEKLKLNQSTVSRRINRFEQDLDVRLFERFNSGFELTAEGDELLRRALRIEEETQAIDRLLMGKNVELSGPIRVTTTLLMAKYYIIPLLHKFYRQHPAIEIQLDLSNNQYNLNAREADVAIRVTRDSIPENLVGRELGHIVFAVFGEKNYLENYLNNNASEALRWIGEDAIQPRPAWLPDSYADLQLVMRSNDVMATLEMIKQGLGVGRLPCVVGDAEPGLQKMAFNHYIPSAPVWLLTHADMRRVNRVKVFNAFIAEELRRQLNK